MRNYEDEIKQRVKYPILSIEQHKEMQIETLKVNSLYKKSFLKNDEKEASPYSANTTAWD